MEKPARALRVRAAGPVFPDELLWEIFVRLPAKEALRCRVVCRDWLRLAASTDLLLAHHRHQPSLPLVFGCVRWRREAAVDLFRRAPAERRRVLGFKDYTHHRSFQIHSCDGLILFVSNHSFYICNPAT